MKRVLTGLMLCAVVVVISGCGTMNMPHGGVPPGIIYGDGVYPSMKDTDTRYLFGRDDIVVLGNVTAQGESFNVLFLVSRGDNGYHRLLEAAREKYPETDALINMYWDTKYFNIGWPYPWIPIYQRATSTVTATAIKLRD